MHYHNRKKISIPSLKTGQQYNSSALVNYVHLAYKWTEAVEHTRQQDKKHHPNSLHPNQSIKTPKHKHWNIKKKHLLNQKCQKAEFEISPWNHKNSALELRSYLTPWDDTIEMSFLTLLAPHLSTSNHYYCSNHVIVNKAL
jgi:hypothetical protein